MKQSLGVLEQRKFRFDTSLSGGGENQRQGPTYNNKTISKNFWLFTFHASVTLAHNRYASSTKTS